MQTLVGIVVWGGLLLAVLAWLGRPGRDAAPPDAAERSVPPVIGGEADRREAEALTDGLIIGHLLTRDHHRRRHEELETELDQLRADRDDHRWAGDEDPDLELAIEEPWDDGPDAGLDGWGGFEDDLDDVDDW